MRAVTNSEPVVVLCQPTCAGGQPAKADARQTCAASKQVRIALDKCRRQTQTSALGTVPV